MTEDCGASLLGSVNAGVASELARAAAFSSCSTSFDGRFPHDLPASQSRLRVSTSSSLPQPPVSGKRCSPLEESDYRLSPVGANNLNHRRRLPHQIKVRRTLGLSLPAVGLATILDYPITRHFRLDIFSVARHVVRLTDTSLLRAEPHNLHNLLRPTTDLKQSP